MEKFNDKRFLQTIVLIFGILSIGMRFLNLFFQIRFPGAEPICAALFWAALWRWNVVLHTNFGTIWNIGYVLIILLNVTFGISQIITALR